MFTLILLLDVIYFFLIFDSFYKEYVADNFVYWGYPQWGWLYANQNTYLTFNVIYLISLFLCMAGATLLWFRKYVKSAFFLSFIPLLSAAVFSYMPTYNRNQLFETYGVSENGDESRIPEGKWWVSAEQMQKYYDSSAWERMKGYFGRGEWPGGYTMWGDYRVWLLPDLATDTKGRRGLVIHGGTLNSSPWGIDLGNNVIDFVIYLRSVKKAVPLSIGYGKNNNDEQNLLEQ